MFKIGWMYSHELYKIYPIWNYQQQFRLNKINEIKSCFVTVIKERELMNKKLNKYISSSD